MYFLLSSMGDWNQWHVVSFQGCTPLKLKMEPVAQYWISRGLKPSFIIKQMSQILYVLKQGDVLVAYMKHQSYPSTCWAIADCYYWSGSCQFGRSRLSGRSGVWTGIVHGFLQFYPLNFEYTRNGFVSSSHVWIVVLMTEKTSKKLHKSSTFWDDPCQSGTLNYKSTCNYWVQFLLR